MSQYDFDLLTIGGGSGGVRASRWAAGLGVKVAICEESRYGGTCVMRGCIPKKLMLVGSELPGHIKYFSAYGWSVGSSNLDWSAQKAARDKELSRLEGIYENLLSKKGVTVLKGHGKIISPHIVKVEDKTYTARFILIAVGGYPYMPDIPGIEYAITSDDVFELPEQPRSILIMGSGYIGVEFASIFNGFGSKVSLVFRRDKPLRGFDEEVRAFLLEEMVKEGIEVIPNNTVEKIIKKGNLLEIHLNRGAIKTVEQVLFATGRKPKIDNLGLESLGIKTNSQGELEVNEYFETSVKGIYALGDCANTPYQLTPVATAEAMLLAEHLFSRSKKKIDYNFIPTAVFSRPPVATVGLTEEQAVDKGYSVSIYTSRFRPLKYTVTTIDKKTFMKIIVDKKTDKVLGVHIVGEDAPEMMQGIAVALKVGAKKHDFDKTIGIHPTSAEEFVTMRTPKN
ncbi:MAG: glutathione-disulfide reductase [Bdellovibrionales bacterium]|nr:glutathione-disulfide reductase [Bdellovibrionales bacterium]